MPQSGDEYQGVTSSARQLVTSDSLRELLWETLVESVGQFVWSTTPEGELHFVNRHWTSYTGMDQELSREGGWVSALHPEDGPAAEAKWDQARQAGDGFSMECRVRRASDGEYRWHMVQVVPAMDADGRVRAWLGVATDIHDPKAMAEALRQANAQFSDALEQMPDAFIALDREWRITYVNPKAAEVNRKPAEEFLGKIMWDEWPALVGEEIEQGYRRAMDNRVPFHVEHHYVGGGHDAWLEIHAYPTTWGLAVYYSDISERKRIERALSESERLYRAMGESIEFGVWVCDADGRNTYASESFLNLVGLTQEECSEFGWGRVLHPDDAERTVAAWKECVRTGGSWDIEHRFLGVDGKYHPILARGVPIRDEGGRIVCWAGINLDIGRLKAVEQELRSANERLERSNAELERFAYLASHDLQEPLRVVTTFSQLLEKRHGGQLDGHAQEFLGHIMEASRRMQRLIADLLEYSRISQTNEPLKEVDTAAMAAMAMQNCRSAIEESGARVTIRELPRTWAIGPRLVQVFQNLLSNAIKYRSEAAPDVTIGAESLDGQVAFFVADNGIGMNAAYHAKIFELFARLHGRDVPGTGVGLAICKRIVEQFGGRIWVESEPGKGSTFRFTMKTVEDPEAGSTTSA